MNKTAFVLKRIKLLFRCFLVIACLMVLTINGYAQTTTIKEGFGTIQDASTGSTTRISVVNGKQLHLFSSDKFTIYTVLLQLSKAEANKLVKIFEKALADLVKPPAQNAKNQTIDKEFGRIEFGSKIIVKVERDSSGASLWVSNYDSDIINKVHLLLNERQAKQYLEALQKAVKSMK